MSKSTDAEISLRVATVSEMLIKGFSRQDILQYCAKEWNIQKRQSDEYIAKAKNKLIELAEKDIEFNKALAIERYNDLYRKNYGIKDYRECRQVQNDIVKLHGIAEPDKVDITTAGKPFNIKDVVEFESSEKDKTK